MPPPVARLGSIGYLDISRVGPHMLAGAFADLEGTAALVIDLRAYPSTAFFAVAAYFTGRPVRAAGFVSPMMTGQP